ncbi:MAG: Gfo/Idh/MocA family oxidoreductase, partial [Candidatus Borkfalkiaceae bacterium]|nr:Gfo/Idh/MocA family oxidoreductase [Christensenellaceae bacterium]
MKRLNLAIIGQGRSGRDIHGVYCCSERNAYYNVKYIVDFDERRRNQAKDLYPGCETFSDYKELFNKDDIDLIVNASFSHMHFEITKELLEHGKNVLVEKPFARNMYECETLINTAKKSGVVLAVFQNTQLAPFYLHALKLASDGTLGEVEQVSIRYNSLSRRWDWQTLQKYMGG